MPILLVSDDSDDDEAEWLISPSLGCSVRSENCEVLRLNSNMVAASLKQSGLVTDRAYSLLTAADEPSLTRNALRFLWLLVRSSSNCYHLFVEAAQALCSRAMKVGGNAVKSRARVSHVSKQTKETEEAGKWQLALAEENLENSEKMNLANGDKENHLYLSQQGLM